MFENQHIPFSGSQNFPQRDFFSEGGDGSQEHQQDALKKIFDGQESTFDTGDLDLPQLNLDCPVEEENNQEEMSEEEEFHYDVFKEKDPLQDQETSTNNHDEFFESQEGLEENREHQNVSQTPAMTTSTSEMSEIKETRRSASAFERNIPAIEKQVIEITESYIKKQVSVSQKSKTKNGSKRQRTKKEYVYEMKEDREIDIVYAGLVDEKKCLKNCLETPQMEGKMKATLKQVKAKPLFRRAFKLSHRLILVPKQGGVPTKIGREGILNYTSETVYLHPEEKYQKELQWFMNGTKRMCFLEMEKYNIYFMRVLKGELKGKIFLIVIRDSYSNIGYDCNIKRTSEEEERRGKIAIQARVVSKKKNLLEIDLTDLSETTTLGSPQKLSRKSSFSSISRFNFKKKNLEVKILFCLISLRLITETIFVIKKRPVLVRELGKREEKIIWIYLSVKS